MPLCDVYRRFVSQSTHCRVYKTQLAWIVRRLRLTGWVAAKYDRDDNLMRRLFCCRVKKKSYFSHSSSSSLTLWQVSLKRRKFPCYFWLTLNIQYFFKSRPILVSILFFLFVSQFNRKENKKDIQTGKNRIYKGREMINYCLSTRHFVVTLSTIHWLFVFFNCNSTKPFHLCQFLLFLYNVIVGAEYCTTYCFKVLTKSGFNLMNPS